MSPNTNTARLEDPTLSEPLISPYGGQLVDLLVSQDRSMEIVRSARDLPSWTLTTRQICDIELLMTGAFSPLRGFLGRRDHDAVCQSMRLVDGRLWPIPILLDVTEELATEIEPKGQLVLRDQEGAILALLDVEEAWTLDRELHASSIYGTVDPAHPGVAHVLRSTHPVAIAGKIQGLQSPSHYDFLQLRRTPAQLRAQFAQVGWHRIVAFQTRNPMHRAHVELTLRAAKEYQAALLLHPVVGATKPGDIDHYTRVRCYQALLSRYPADGVMLALLPLAMRMAGPRETLLHAIIRRNYGCTHLIVGRDHAGPGNDLRGKPFYAPYAAQELLASHAKEIGIEMAPYPTMVYAEERGEYYPEDQVPSGSRVVSISGADLRARLAAGREIPEWFTYPEIATELRRCHPPRCHQGFTVFFTGLSGAGKSTIANVLLVKLLEIGGRQVTLLDGDIVRRNLSSELGFSKEHRDINIRRIGFVAAEITKNGGIAICAPIAPYESVRREVRESIEPLGGFTLVHVATPLAVCEKRDRKGLYARARAGLLPAFTGISDPYEEPTTSELRLDTSDLPPEDAAQQILSHLRQAGFFESR